MYLKTTACFRMFALVFTYSKNTGARFSKALETFRAGEAIFSSFVFKNGEFYTPKTSSMERTSVHIKNIKNKTVRVMAKYDYGT